MSSSDDDTTPLAQLCAPLSAKVMPKAAGAGVTSRSDSESEVLSAQRRMRRHGMRGTQAPKPAPEE